MDDLVDRTRELSAQVEQLRMRSEQLETIARYDWELQEQVARLPAILDSVRIDDHVRAAVHRAALVSDPFPHVVVDRWLPGDVYQVIIRALPPAVFFADRDASRQRMTVPFSFAPVYSRKVWAFVADEIVGRILHAALNQKFADVVRSYARETWGCGVDDIDLTLHPSDGRIMLRRPGYVIDPHRDPRWGFITGLVYLARPGDPEAYGTQLYRVRDDTEAPDAKPWYFEPEQCERVREVPFKANTLLAFLNSHGAHGASIPADAQPASLERYVYQFRLGPDNATISRLLALMPPDQRRRWAGAKAEKAAAIT